ncbi:MAG: S1C family serine protease [Phycisphaerales bacterium]|nr:S1C family serine protease [Phycisphaerales bacterium]
MLCVLCVSRVWGGGFDRAVETVLPRVVKLYGLGVGTQAGYGSGVLVSADGLVLTVFSLLIDSDNIRAVTSDGTVYGADVVYRDPARQLALLRLKPAAGDATLSGSTSVGATLPGDHSGEKSDDAIGPLPYFDVTCVDSGGQNESGDEEASCLGFLKPGDWVVAAGNSFKVADGMEAVSVFHGVFSARMRLDARRKVKDFPYHGEVLAIDAITSNPGAPGSAVVDVEGRFVGMIGRVVISNRTHTHFNYAVPREVLWDSLREAADPSARAATRLTRRSKDDGESAAVDVGIRITRTGYRELPPFVERVRGGSPAERAGVQKDDLILSINNANVGEVREFDERWRMLKAGESIDLVIRRGRRIMNVRIESERPQ